MELVGTYRWFGSPLEGHPTPVLPWVDVATGSLSQGLPDGVGVALAGRYLDELPYQVWVLRGDSEGSPPATSSRPPATSSAPDRATKPASCR